MVVDRTKLIRKAGKIGVALLTEPLPAHLRSQLRLRWRGHVEESYCRRGDALVLSRPKSGRTWVRAVLSVLYQRRHGLPEDELLEFDNLYRRNRHVPKIAFVHGHALAQWFERPQTLSQLAHKPVLFLIRHPCDTAVSQFFQSTRREKHKQQQTLHGVALNQPLFDFVWGDKLGGPGAAAYLNEWRRRLAPLPGLLTVRYEDLRADPDREFLRLANHLDRGAAFTADEVAVAVRQCSFDEMKRKEREQAYKNSRLKARDADDPESFKVRRGKVGGFRDYFSSEQATQLETYVLETLHPDLGYGVRQAEQPAPEITTPA
jgi:hypothetical protein